jgi:small subunit ribosomal protein S8
MPVTDPISDYLTRIRNASKARKIKVEIPSSKMKEGLSAILKKNGFIYDFKVEDDNKQNVITVLLRYSDGKPAINGIKRISKPGLRVYSQASDLPRVYNGLGTAIISTSKGLLTEKEARSQSTGGEVVCYVW